MTLTFLFAWLILGGLLAWLAGRWNKEAPRWISLGFMIVHLIVSVRLWISFLTNKGLTLAQGEWFLMEKSPWIPQWGIQYFLAVDGLSILLIVLTSFLGLLAVACSWKGIQERVGFFFFNLLWILAGISGVFMALDLFLFYFFWEIMLIPLYFLIGIWGHSNRIYATIKFFIFTQASGLFMLISILALYFIHGSQTGHYTFDYVELLGTQVSPKIAFWLMLGFFLGFGVKLPAVPVHTWLPDAHTEAPTAGSVVLAGLVLKAGAYGFIRFLMPLFPQAGKEFAMVAMILGIIGIIYAAMVAFAQNDLKRLVAYTSVSHMGFVLLGVFAWNQLALQGAVMIILSHGLSTGALFILVGDIYDRLHTRDMDKLGGLWSVTPRLGGFGMVFALASLGLPGLANFVGEFLVLLGVYQVSVPIAALATLGFIASTIYSLWMIQKTFFGKNVNEWKMPDATPREISIYAALVVALLWLGLFPNTVLRTSRQALKNLQQITSQYFQGSKEATTNPSVEELNKSRSNYGGLE
ncbi:MAG: NADH-quinone oxidoreductase subunit M [Caldisericaceae bacterium]|nr:NADH-quinone oxidoreductase subunit M [Caldisericaceae bacterium]